VKKRLNHHAKQPDTGTLEDQTGQRFLVSIPDRPGEIRGVIGTTFFITCKAKRETLRRRTIMDAPLATGPKQACLDFFSGLYPLSDNTMDFLKERLVVHKLSKDTILLSGD
jgi:hypothetical protein